MTQPSSAPMPRSATTASLTEKSFEAFVQGSMPAWVRYAHLHVGSREDAELVAFEVALQLQEKWAYILGHVQNIPAYALAMLRGEIETRFPHQGGDQLVENAAFLRAMRAAKQEFAVLAESIGLFSAISRLPERQFQVIVLRYVMEYGVKRAAALMGVSEPTIASLTYYAKRTLARDLGFSVKASDKEDEL